MVDLLSLAYLCLVIPVFGVDPSPEVVRSPSVTDGDASFYLAIQDFDMILVGFWPREAPVAQTAVDHGTSVLSSTPGT
jgi:hypothetical protein